MADETYDIRLGFDVDRTGADRYQDLYERAKRNGAIQTRLSFNVESSAFKLYEQLVSKAERLGPVVTELKAKVDKAGFVEYERLVQKAKQNGAASSSELKFDVKTAGFDAYRRLIARARALGPVITELKFDVDHAGFAAYRALVARASLFGPVSTSLNFSVNPAGFLSYQAMLASLAGSHTTTLGGSGGGIGGGIFRTMFTSLSGLMVLLPAFLSLVGMVAQAFSALTAGVTSLVSALAPLGGLLATLPAAFGALGTVIGVIFLATQGLGDAIKDAMEPTSKLTTAMRQQTTASDQLLTARQTLATAMRSEGQAQKDLTQAREDARIKIEDLRRAVERSALSEERANLSVAEARQHLQEILADPTASREEVKDAELRVKEAQLALKDAKDEATKTKAESRKAQNAGVGGADNVIRAQQAVADAATQVANANRDVARAQVDVADATRAVVAEQNKLTPTQKRFASFIVGLKPLFKDLQETAAKGLLPGVQEGLHALTGGFGTFRGVIKGAAEALGDVAANAGKKISSPEWLHDIDTMGERNNVLLRTMGSAFGHVADAVRHVTIAAGPLTQWLAKSIDLLAGNTAAAAKAGRENGKLAAFFAKTRDVVTVLARILGNVAQALLNTGSAGYKTGRGLLDSIERLTARWEKWTASIEGHNALTKWFESSRAPLKEMALLIGAIASGFMSLGNNEGGQGLTTFLKQIRTEALPAFLSMLDKLSTTVGPAIVSVLSDLITIFSTLTQYSFGLQIVAGAIATVTGAIADLFRAVPGLAQVLGALGTAVVLIKTFTMIRTALIALRAGFIAFFWTLNANPIILGITLIITALVLLVTHWDKVKHAASIAINWIGEKTSWLWDKIKSFGSWLATAFVSLARKGFLGPVPLIISRWGSIVNFFTSLPGRIADGLKSLPGMIGHLFSRGADLAVGFFRALPGRLLNGLKQIFSLGGGLISNFGTGLRKWINDHTLFGDHIKLGPLNVTIPRLATGGIIGGNRDARGPDDQMILAGRGESIFNARQTDAAETAISQVYGMDLNTFFSQPWAAHSSFAKGGIVGARDRITNLDARRETANDDYGYLQRDLQRGGLTAAEINRLQGAKAGIGSIITQEQQLISPFLSAVKSELSTISRSLRQRPSTVERNRLLTRQKEYQGYQDDIQKIQDSLRGESRNTALDLAELSDTYQEAMADAMAQTSQDGQLKELQLQLLRDRLTSTTTDDDATQAKIKSALEAKRATLEARYTISKTTGNMVAADKIYDALSSTLSELSSYTDNTGTTNSQASQYANLNAAKLSAFEAYSSIGPGRETGGTGSGNKHYEYHAHFTKPPVNIHQTFEEGRDWVRAQS
jgi:hypothetical protein